MSEPEPRTFIIRHGERREPRQMMLFGLNFQEREKLRARVFFQIGTLSISERVAYCRCCQKHYDAESFAKLFFVGFQRDDSGAAILELRNCRYGNTIAVEVPQVTIDTSEAIPDTERPEAVLGSESKGNGSDASEEDDSGLR